MRDVTIIGGGISGLTAAYTLAKAGRPATLVEQETTLGGVMQTKHLAGCVIEGGPDSFLAAKPAAAQLINEVGLGAELTLWGSLSWPAESRRCTPRRRSR